MRTATAMIFKMRGIMAAVILVIMSGGVVNALEYKDCWYKDMTVFGKARKSCPTEKEWTNDGWSGTYHYCKCDALMTSTLFRLVAASTKLSTPKCVATTGSRKTKVTNKTVAGDLYNEEEVYCDLGDGVAVYTQRLQHLVTVTNKYKFNFRCGDIQSYIYSNEYMKQDAWALRSIDLVRRHSC